MTVHRLLVATRALPAGACATPSSPIMTLASSSVEVHVTVEEARVGQVQAGQPVQLTVPAYPGVTFPARITTIATVNFEITVSASDSGSDFQNSTLRSRRSA